MRIKHEQMEELKKLVKDEYGVEYTDKQAYEAAQNLIDFSELLFEIWMREQKNKKTKGVDKK